jgi:hypothetical protein
VQACLLGKRRGVNLGDSVQCGHYAWTLPLLLASCSRSTRNIAGPSVHVIGRQRTKRHMTNGELLETKQYRSRLARSGLADVLDSDESRCNASLGPLSLEDMAKAWQDQICPVAEAQLRTRSVPIGAFEICCPPRLGGDLASCCLRFCCTTRIAAVFWARLSYLRKAKTACETLLAGDSMLERVGVGLRPRHPPMISWLDLLAVIVIGESLRGVPKMENRDQENKHGRFAQACCIARWPHPF